MKPVLLRHFGLRKAVAATFILGLVTGNGAKATGVPVIDAAALSQQVMEFAETVAQWAKEVEYYKKTYDQYASTVSYYQQKLMQLKSLNFQVKKLSTQLVERPNTFGLQERCGVETGMLGNLATLATNPVQYLSQNSATVEQRKVCEQIVAAENEKYNSNIRFMKRSVELQNQFITEIEQKSLSGAGESEGAYAAHTDAIQRFNARTSMEERNWVVQQRAYSDYIDSMKSQHASIAKKAFEGADDGKNALTRMRTSLIKAAVLKSALCSPLPPTLGEVATPFENGKKPAACMGL